MNRHWWVTCLAVVALSSGLASCSGDDEPDTKPTTPTTSASPTEAPQPKGADGVTVDIQNWESHAEDPAVLAFKKATESVNASANKRKILPDFRAGFSKKPLRTLVTNVRLAWRNNWHVAPVLHAKVRRSERQGSKVRLVMCQWAPSHAYLKKNNTPVKKPKRVWDQVVYELSPKADSWVITSFKLKGRCPGGAPS